MNDDPFAPLPPVPGPPTEPATATATTTDIITPAPQPLPESIQHRRFGIATQTWRYCDAQGATLFAVVRFDPPQGKKQVLPFTCTATGWGYKAPPAPRPLYGLDRLAAALGARVLVVEGEKAAEAARGLFPDHVAITWQGGCQAVSKADWNPLRGRPVTIWPDNDAAGRKAAAAVQRALTEAGVVTTAIVDVPTAWPEGWDVADALPEGVTQEALLAMLAAADTAVLAPEDLPATDRDAELQRLARLDDVSFAMERRQAARNLGISVARQSGCDERDNQDESPWSRRMDDCRGATVRQGDSCRARQSG